MLMQLPKLDLNIRPAVLDDLPFIDALQKKQSKRVGFMQRKALEGKIALGEIIVAEANGEPVGYLIGQDRYFKHDDVGIIYQINVAEGRQRGFIGAALLRAQFERSAYGCRLYCCWCAQDIEANYFWESMGFVPLAFRTGSRTKGKGSTPRIHIFWQKRIRSGDVTTRWWFPSQTSGGSIREDRLVLPIPPGVHWSEVQAVVLPGMNTLPLEGVSPETPLLEDQKPAARESRPPRASRKIPPPTKPNVSFPEDEVVISNNGLRFASPKPVKEIKPESVEPAPRQPRRKPQKVKQKNDPVHIAAARELRDRWLEKVNEAGHLLESAGKYDVSRAIDDRRQGPLQLAA